MRIKLSKSQWEQIGKTTGWLRKSQNVQNIREFYHGTSSGTNNQNIISFKKGINPSMAKGYGQGEGFYVWLNKNNAINHSKEFSSGGYPMIVTVQAELSPQNFDLDHEAMSSMTGQFIADTWDVLFKKLPEGSIQTERGIINILKSRKIPSGPSAGAMQFFFTNGKIATKSPNTESNVGTGELFGAIFNILQKQFPQQTSDFELKAFSQVVNNSNAALKYVGSQTLIPSKIECFVNNQWIDAINQNIPQQVQSQQPQATSLEPAAQPAQPAT